MKKVNLPEGVDLRIYALSQVSCDLVISRRANLGPDEIMFTATELQPDNSIEYGLLSDPDTLVLVHVLVLLQVPQLKSASQF